MSNLQNALSNVADTAVSATAVAAPVVTGVLSAAVNSAGAAVQGSSQVMMHDKHFHMSRYNQVMIFYIFLTILFGVLGARLLKKYLTNDDIVGAILGLMSGMILSKFLWIIFGNKYSQDSDKDKDMKHYTPEPTPSSSS